MSPMSSETQNEGARLIRLNTIINVAACIIVVFVTAESGAWLGLSLLEGRWVGYATLANELHDIVNAPSTENAFLHGTSLPHDKEILHPYFGVSYPMYFRKNVRNHGQETLMDYGWKDGAGPLVRTHDPHQIVINITGGSVARGFVDWGGQDALRDELKKLNVFPGKEVVFSSTAFYGHKEPQQLLAINYLLTLGAKFDIIITLDGFNEITMAKAYNEGSGTSNIYPFGWHGRLSEINPDPAVNILRGEGDYLRAQRASSAAMFLHAPLRFSMLAGLLWKALDRHAEADINAATLAMNTKSNAHDGVTIDTGPVPHYDSVKEYLEDQVSIWKEATRQLSLLSAANGIRFFALLQPNQYTGHHVMNTEEHRIAWRKDQDAKPLVEQGYPMLRDAGNALRKDGVMFEDVSNVFDDISSPVYTDDCCHFNSPPGNAILAKRIATILAQAMKK